MLPYSSQFVIDHIYSNLETFHVCDIVFNSSKRDVVNQCYENARKDGCSLTSNIENLVAQRFASQICPAVRPALPTNCY